MAAGHVVQVDHDLAAAATADGRLLGLEGHLLAQLRPVDLHQAGVLADPGLDERSGGSDPRILRFHQFLRLASRTGESDFSQHIIGVLLQSPAIAPDLPRLGVLSFGVSHCKSGDDGPRRTDAPIPPRTERR